MSRKPIRQLTPAERATVADFVKLRVAHPKLDLVDQQTNLMIDHPSDSAAVLVQGPTGVGKSTLAERIARSIAETQREALANDPQLYPPLLIRAPAPAGSQFNWHDFLHRALVELGEPAVEEKGSDARKRNPARRAATFRTIDGIRMAFEDAVRARRPKAIIVDEAQHLTHVGKGARLSHQLDFIKSLSDASESVFVLVGTYELSTMRNLSGQLGRRCLDVHFSRYHWDIPTERSQFASVVDQFATGLPVDAAMLQTELAFLYERSAGCVGILKPWLVRALIGALRQNRAITFDDLEAKSLSAKALDVIADEIIDGEAQMDDDQDTVRGLREKLGLITPPMPDLAPALSLRRTAPPKQATAITAPEGSRQARTSAADATIPTRRQPARVGRRGPHRDTVGSAS
jgi:energy-coupling factor transporter ATP-binding protein EcfA2